MLAPFHEQTLQNECFFIEVVILASIAPQDDIESQPMVLGDA